MLSFARGACERGIALEPEPKVKGAILYNVGLVEEKTGDLNAACAALRQSVAIRPNSVVQKKFYELNCPEIAAVSAPSPIVAIDCSHWRS